eukprot:2782245-Pyramimonas_sp.AAC.1
MAVPGHAGVVSDCAARAAEDRARTRRRELCAVVGGDARGKLDGAGHQAGVGARDGDAGQVRPPPNVKRITESTNQSVNQSINRSTNHSIN